MERLKQDVDHVIACAVCKTAVAAVHDNGSPKCGVCALIALNERIAALEDAIANLRESV